MLYSLQNKCLVYVTEVQGARGKGLLDSFRGGQAVSFTDGGLRFRGEIQ